MRQNIIQSRVKNILEEYEEARDSDWVLVGKYMERYYPRLKSVEGIYMMIHSESYKLPSYESISRARRRIQSEHIELQGKNCKVRTIKEFEFKEYYGRNKDENSRD